MLAARPTVISSIMGLFDATYVRRIHHQGAAWFACATTLDEALAAQDAGADAIVAQAIEAGGHRGTFQLQDAERIDVGLFALIPRLVDGLRVPVIAAGGIADERGVAAALALGASAVQIGTALLRAPETDIPREWSADLHELAPEVTVTTRAYSGRLGRAAPTPYLRTWMDPDAPHPAPISAAMPARDPGPPATPQRAGSGQPLGWAERGLRHRRTRGADRDPDVARRHVPPWCRLNRTTGLRSRGRSIA